ncbi:MAG: hypothetical protein DRI57_06005 [Deltaproteobacteria bacterium]|nr:MAG: hypothetical protein DRI57_06005 [Deltaproteobacteria bacterium]
MLFHVHNALLSKLKIDKFRLSGEKSFTSVTGILTLCAPLPSATSGVIRTDDFVSRPHLLYFRQILTSDKGETKLTH